MKLHCFRIHRLRFMNSLPLTMNGWLGSTTSYSPGSRASRRHLLLPSIDVTRRATSFRHTTIWISPEQESKDSEQHVDVHASASFVGTDNNVGWMFEGLLLGIPYLRIGITGHRRHNTWFLTTAKLVWCHGTDGATQKPRKSDSWNVHLPQYQSTGRKTFWCWPRPLLVGSLFARTYTTSERVVILILIFFLQISKEAYRNDMIPSPISCIKSFATPGAERRSCFPSTIPTGAADVRPGPCCRMVSVGVPLGNVWPWSAGGLKFRMFRKPLDRADWG